MRKPFAGFLHCFRAAVPGRPFVSLMRLERFN